METLSTNPARGRIPRPGAHDKPRGGAASTGPVGGWRLTVGGSGGVVVPNVVEDLCDERSSTPAGMTARRSTKAYFFFEDFLVEEDFFAVDFFAEDFFDDDFFDPPLLFFDEDFFDEDFFAGTLPPAARASDKPMAMACLRLFTFLPELPLFSVPRLRSCIAFSTLSCAFFPYLDAMDKTLLHSMLCKLQAGASTHRDVSGANTQVP